MLNAARTRWFYEFQKYRKDKRMRMFEESFESNDTDDGKVEAEKEDAQNVSAPPQRTMHRVETAALRRKR